MDIIQFKEANCKGCYKCIRNCEIKAIKVIDDQAKIMDDECVYCGKCTIVCPQNAKVISSDLEKARTMIKQGYKLYASLAPSYVTAFPDVSFRQMSAALKKLGFVNVEETAIGASMVSAEYAKLMKKHEMKNIITTCCPTINLLVEKYYPELVQYLAPVVAPATAHAKAMKELYGNRIKVIFIGPCISKKYESKLSNNINAVLMFDEIKEWLNEEGIGFSDSDEEPNEMHNTISRFYPAPQGIIKTIPGEIRKNYKTVAIDGLDRCISVLKTLRDENIEGYFLEMNSCVGSCSNGPGMHGNSMSLLKAKDVIIENVCKKTTTPKPLSETIKIDMHKSFDLTYVKEKVPDEETIASILASIGKTSPEQMLNCGACGYNTCREKAIAVYQGKADLKMCIPYMRERAESMSNIILDNTPDAIFVTDSDFNIIEYNHSAANMFRIDNTYIGLPIDMIINSKEFQDAKVSDENVYYVVCHDSENNLVLNVSIVKAPDNDFIIIIKDITQEHMHEEELQKIRDDTLETAQRVIDKQMRVAQEIASLLGETTGETKAALMNLKKSIIAQDKNI